MLYELVGYNTDSRYYEDIRWRSYTTSKKKAEKFKLIPKIQFQDSGHGIVFEVREHHSKRLPDVRIVSEHIYKHMRD